MSTYKLIQDVEAEDHILGPLTLRQFIFALVTTFLLYINFLVATKATPFLLIVFLPPALLTGFFSFPFGRDQPTEIWALAKIRFWFVPHKRIWNQSGLKELVTITAPKKVEHVYTDGLSQMEVKSRLKTLANTIDSRGWAVKNVNLNDFTSSPLEITTSDRLVDPSSIPQAVSDEGIQASDDMLDAQNNPIAKQFDDMINQASQAQRSGLIDEMNDVRPTPVVISAADSPWFMPPTAAPAIPVAAQESAEETALAAKIQAEHKRQPAAYSNLRTIQPLSNQPPPPPVIAPVEVIAPSTTDPALIALSKNDDLNVSTLAREAKKAKGDEPAGGEVTISLH